MIKNYINYNIDFTEICKLVDYDKYLTYILYYDDLTINRDYNSISDPDYSILNIINKLIDEIYYFPCRNDSNGFKKPYERYHLY